MKLTCIASSKLKNLWPLTLENANKIEEANGRLSSVLLRSFHIACPIRTQRKRSQAPWWNKGMSEGRNKIQKLYNTAKKYNSQPDWESYRAELKILTKQLRTAMRKEWIDFCSKVEKTSDTAHLGKIPTKKEKAPVLIQKGNGN